MAPRFLPLLVVLLTLGTTSPSLQAQSLLLEGESYRVNKTTQSYTYLNPRVIFGDVTILADRLVYDKKTERLDFEGNVLVQQTGFLLTARRATYLIKTDELSLDEATLFDEKQQAYAEAKKIVKVDKEKFEIIEGSVTLCDPEEPAWVFEGSKIVYEADNFAYILNSTIYLHGLPIFYSPFFSWPTKTGRASGVLSPEIESQFGSSDRSKRWGHRVKIPYFIEFGKEHDLTLTADILSQRGLGVGVDYNYAFIPGMRGELSLWYLDETVQDRSVEYENLGSKSIDSVDLRPTRYKYSFNHRQNIFWEGQFFYEQRFNHDNEINKEYFNSSVSKDVSQTQSMSFVFPWLNGGFTLSAQKQENFLKTSIYDRETDRSAHLNTLPKATLSHRFEQIGGSKATFSLDSTFTRYRRIEGWEGILGSGKTKLTYPLQLNFLNILPEYERNSYYFDVTYNRSSSENSSMDFDENPSSFGWNIDTRQIELNLELFKLYHNERDEAVGRLSFLPRLIYKEVDDVDQRRSLATTPANNTLSYTDDDYSFPGHNSGSFKSMFLSPLAAQKNLTFRWETLFQTKDPKTKKIQSALQFNLIQIFDLLQLDENRQSLGPQTYATYLESETGDPRLPLRLEMILTPVSFFSTNLFYRYDYNDNKIVETRLGVTATSLKGEKFSLSYNNNTRQYHELDGTNHNVSKSLTLSRDFSFSDKLNVTMDGTWDLTRTDLASQYAADNAITRLGRQLTSGSLGLVFTEDCYRVSFSYFEKLKTRSINESSEEYVDRSISLTFNLSAWPADSGGQYQASLGL